MRRAWAGFTDCRSVLFKKLPKGLASISMLARVMPRVKLTNGVLSTCVKCYRSGSARHNASCTEVSRCWHASKEVCHVAACALRPRRVPATFFNKKTNLHALGVATTQLDEQLF